MGHLQDLLVADSPAWGVWLNLGSAVSAEIASLAGYDWLLVDLEHGSGDSRDLSLQLWAAQAGESATIVRVASLNAAEIKRVLDMGPAGVMIPNVETLAQAQAAVAAVRIPPLGARGAATSTRSSRYGFGYEHYIQTANRDLQLVVQIESVIGVENAAAIACTPGIDALFVGPLDLSVSMGITDPDRDARFASALEKVVRAAAAAGKTSGILVRSAAQAKRYLGLGFRLLAMGSDRGMLASAMRRDIDVLRSLPTVDE